MLSHAKRTPRGTLTFAAVAALLLSLLWSGTPAFAHDELVGTDPAADAVIEASPAQVTLTFSGELLAEDGATAVEVVDAAGASLAGDAPVTSGTVVTQTLTGEASGTVRVLWKVVSSDGHPISGEYSFTVNAPAPEPEPVATETDDPMTTAAPPAEPTAAPTAVPISAEDGDAGVLWVVGGVVVVVIAGAVAYLLVSRRRRENAAAKAAGSDSDAPSGR